MNIPENEFSEWHETVLRQRNRYRWFIESIITGVPTIGGMASSYRHLTLKEIREQAKEFLK